MEMNHAKCVLVLIALLFVNDWTDSLMADKSVSRHYNQFSLYKNEASKGLPLFMVVNFDNGVCTGNNGINGTCLPTIQCYLRGGKCIGACAARFGACCRFEKSCGASSRINNTHFVNPFYPGPYNTSRSCSFTVIKANPNICQLRIDMERFRLSPPTLGECDSDTFVITCGTSTNIPILCGNNTGQHVYINFPRNVNECMLNVMTSGGVFNRTFDMRVSQIPCNSQDLAPSGCLQYYRSTTGTISSFNTDTQNILTGVTYPTNANYGICIRQEAGYCSIRYFPSLDNGYFQLDSGGNTSNCPDYLLIPRGLPEITTNSDRYCGSSFSPVTTSAKPFTVYVDSDSNAEGASGFKLDFNQIICNQ